MRIGIFVALAFDKPLNFDQFLGEEVLEFGKADDLRERNYTFVLPTAFVLPNTDTF